MSNGHEEDRQNSSEKGENIKEQNIEEDWEEVELFWDGVPGIQFTKEVSQLCEDIFDDEEYFVLSDYWVSNLLKELDGGH